MTKSAVQLRGHCQCCGHQQALRNGRMAHHGYTVRNGWFQGKCHGYQYAPVEVSRTALDRTVEAIRDQITTMRESASMLSSKANWPKTAMVYNRMTRKDELVALADLSEEKARQIVDRQIYEYKARAEAGEAHIAYLRNVAATFHGKPLIEAPRDAGPEKIVPGEVRMSQTGRTLYAEGTLRGGKVQYSYKQANGTENFGRMSTRAWRALTKA